MSLMKRVIKQLILHCAFYYMSGFIRAIIRGSFGFDTTPAQPFHLEQAAELLEAHQNTPLCSFF